MGASESVEAIEDEEHDGYKEDINDQGDYETIKLLRKDMTNILEHDLEMTPSISSLSPQLSSFDTPRIDQSIKDLNSLYGTSNMTCNFSLESLNDDRTTEIYVICHGECRMKLKPDLVSGRCPEASLTPNGKRQSRALAVFLKSQGIRFNAIYTSPLDRARATAIPVCQEMNFPEHMIQASDALQDMSQGIWGGCHYSDVYTPSVVSIMERLQPDFCPPSGETLRQVEFRMMEFLNATVTCLPENLKCDFSHLDSVPPLPKLDLSTRPRLGAPKKKSSKSRLQMVHTSADHEADDEMTPRAPSKHREPKVFPEPIMEKNSNNNNNHANNNNSHLSTDLSCCIGMFSHSIPIKCLVTGILGCSPTMSNKICIEDSSITVLQYSQKMGWQIKRVNDTCHLRLM
ncbi:hypothetical protein CTI12_AA000270 [Artemisia annua]|uniref:Phosphoglycerate mutase family protein n=1 Tax=Artemisia annua TaxID=35608 RepID=A0A2U1QJN6_ARTAN|nr:hypothetical protein CTI12_AA000270 [Artemisia annua]